MPKNDTRSTDFSGARESHVSLQKGPGPPHPFILRDKGRSHALPALETEPPCCLSAQHRWDLRCSTTEEAAGLSPSGWEVRRDHLLSKMWSVCPAARLQERASEPEPAPRRPKHTWQTTATLLVTFKSSRQGPFTTYSLGRIWGFESLNSKKQKPLFCWTSFNI